MNQAERSDVVSEQAELPCLNVRLCHSLARHVLPDFDQADVPPFSVAVCFRVLG